MHEEMISLPIVVMREGKWFVASCPPLDIATQGETEEEVKENMADLIREYLQDRDTKKPEKTMELTSLSFIHAKISRGGPHGKINFAADQ